MDLGRCLMYMGMVRMSLCVCVHMCKVGVSTLDIDQLCFLS
jgi:hypothetical protein